MEGSDLGKGWFAKSLSNAQIAPFSLLSHLIVWQIPDGGKQVGLDLTGKS